MKKANLLAGKELASEIEGKLKVRVAKLKANGITPTLAAILVGKDLPSQIYIRVKAKAAKRIGVDFLFYHLPKETKEEVIKSLMKDLNQTQSVHGILLQLPLPNHLKTAQIIAQIKSSKDIDGLKRGSLFSSPAASAVLRLLKYYKIKIQGKKVVIVGSGRLVGKPLLKLLKKVSKVVALNRKTQELPQKIKGAEILVSATGVPHLITSDLVNPQMVVVDMGGTKDKEGHLLGDVDFERVSKIVKAITPVPGGVGPVTVALLLENLVLACERIDIKT